MATATHPVPARVAADLCAALYRLRLARQDGDLAAEIGAEMWLNDILDTKMPRKESV